MSDSHGGSATGLVQAVVWPPLRVLSIIRESNGGARLQANGIPGRTNVIEVAAAFTGWRELGVAREESPGMFGFHDTNATVEPLRFYRIREQ